MSLSGKKWCRLCLNEVFVASTNMWSSDRQTKDMLISIFPEMNVSLTKIIRLCEECFQNVNFVFKVNEGFLKKKRELQKTNGSAQCCKLCFKFETPCNIFFHKNNYPSAALEEMENTAIIKPNFSTANDKICGICMSWIKKIYTFKRQCLKMEESLLLYCTRKNLAALEDRDLQDFLDEQYFLRTGMVFPDSQSGEIRETFNREESVSYHEEHFRLTGEVFSNLGSNTLSFGSNMEHGENSKSSQEFEEGNDVVLVLDGGDTNSVEDKIDVEEHNLTFDAMDDVFVDHGAKNSSAVPIIVLDDEDNDENDSVDNKDACERNLAMNVIYNHHCQGDLVSDVAQAVGEKNDIFSYEDDTASSINTETALSSPQENNSYRAINDLRSFEDNDVVVIDNNDDGRNRSDTIIDLTSSDDNIFGYTQDVDRCRRELYGDRKFWGCYICVAIFDDKKTMKKHLLNHEEPWNKYGKFRCGRCPFRANWKGSVTKHAHFHSEKTRNRFAGKKLRYICPYCNGIYLDKGGIQSHMNDHIVSWKEFHCAECMFTSNTSVSLKSHYQNNHCKRRDPSFRPYTHDCIYSN